MSTNIQTFEGSRFLSPDTVLNQIGFAITYEQNMTFEDIQELLGLLNATDVLDTATEISELIVTEDHPMFFAIQEVKKQIKSINPELISQEIH